jgi:hypothetical protein
MEKFLKPKVSEARNNAAEASDGVLKVSSENVDKEMGGPVVSEVGLEHGADARDLTDEELRSLKAAFQQGLELMKNHPLNGKED